MPELEDFPHHGEHLVNDTFQSELTLGLLAVLALLATLVAVIAL